MCGGRGLSFVQEVCLCVSCVALVSVNVRLQLLLRKA